MKIVQRQAPGQVDLPEDMHPVLRQVLSNRGVVSAADIDYSLDNLLSFDSLSNIGAATDLLVDTIENKRRILIIADYDADGATACAVAIRGLTAMGTDNIQYLVPDRARHGYGLSTDVTRLALEYDPDLLITVDNGISSMEGIRFARDAGVDVLVTDHHLPGESLPDASVIVNPNLERDRFQSKNIAGVGVIFYVLLALRARLREMDWFRKKELAEPNLASLLDIVALGTIADVVNLDFNNRILVHNGLLRIRGRHCCQGILALLHLAGRAPEKASASDLGFVLGPRLNAAGRLQDMSVGIECLLSDDFDHALTLAGELDQLNRQRKVIQQEMQDEAEKYLLTDIQDTAGELPDGICMYDETWHQGVIGILASRLKEMCNRPVFVFARDEDGDYKGSGRSVDGIHLKDVLERLAGRNPGLILKFGGHAMAAGLSIRADHFERFREMFAEEVARVTEGKPFADVIQTDGELMASDFSLDLAGQLEQSGPWGQGFPEPAFHGSFSVTGSRVVAEKHLRLRLKPDGCNTDVDAIAFNTPADTVSADMPLQMVYRLSANEYRGKTMLQLVIEHFS